MRNPVFDFFFSLITHLGEETFFLVFAIIFFWCVNKREGYYILTAGLIGTALNQLLKIVCKVPRPWVKDPAFTIVESARAEATGYSFPSGHTQNAASTFGAIGRFTKRNWVRWSVLVLIILVSLSRMYLGVHTPADVLVSLGIGAFLVFVLYPVFSTEEKFHKHMPKLLGISVGIALGFAIYAFTLSPEGIDPHNFESAKKNAATLLGCLFGFCLVYPLDRTVIKFETKANWYSQIIKLLLGLGIVLAIKEGLRSPLEALVGIFTDTPEYIARAIRYFIVVGFAGAVWPLTFGFFGKLKISFMERFTLWLKSKLSKKQHAPTHND